MRLNDLQGVPEIGEASGWNARASPICSGHRDRRLRPPLIHDGMMIGRKKNHVIFIPTLYGGLDSLHLLRFFL